MQITAEGCPAGRFAHTMTRVGDGSFYVVAGQGASDTLFDDVTIYEVQNNRWVAHPGTHKPRKACGHSTVFANNRLFVFGGEPQGDSAERIHLDTLNLTGTSRGIALVWGVVCSL